jgi:hypothetical protein
LRRFPSSILPGGIPISSGDPDKGSQLSSAYLDIYKIDGFFTVHGINRIFTGEINYSINR